MPLSHEDAKDKLDSVLLLSLSSLCPSRARMQLDAVLSLSLSSYCLMPISREDAKGGVHRIDSLVFIWNQCPSLARMQNIHYPITGYRF